MVQQSIDSDTAGGALALARFVSETRFDDLPQNERWQAKSRILDALLCVFAGRASDASCLASAQGRRWARDDGRASLWLSDLRGTAEDCAFANSILVHSILLDDLPVHAGCVTVPVALALAEEHGATGAETIAAIALGYEIELRMDLGHLSHRLMARGFRHSSVNATYAATATAASIMRLSTAATADAFGLATALVNPGTMEPMGKAGSSERFVQMAGNARAGVLAATLAQTGFQGSRETFDGRAGLFDTYDGASAWPGGMLDGLGARWHLDRVAMKPYPSAGSGTLPIYCAGKAARAGIVAADIRTMRLVMRPWGPMVGAVDRGPFTNGEQAMVSAPFGVASTLVIGAYTFDTVVAGVGDPVIDRLAAMIEVVAAPEAIADPAAARLEITLADGSVRTFDAADMPASLTGPVDWDGMVARMERLTPGLSPGERARIVDAVATLDTADTCASLIACLRG